MSKPVPADMATSKLMFELIAQNADGYYWTGPHGLMRAAANRMHQMRCRIEQLEAQPGVNTSWTADEDTERQLVDAIARASQQGGAS